MLGTGGMTMREILFRGKRTDNGEWVEGYYIHRPTAVCIGESNPSCIWVPAADPDDDTKIFEVFPETVGQYTGLTDKNGRKIFEGDIVEGNSEYFTYTHPYGKVVYDGGQYLISFDDVLEDIECLGAWANDVEIIGNIYDNPELLEVKPNEM